MVNKTDLVPVLMELTILKRKKYMWMNNWVKNHQIILMIELRSVTVPFSSLSNIIAF